MVLEYYNLKLDQVQIGLLIGMLIEKFTNYPAYKMQLQELMEQLQDKYDNLKDDCGEEKRDTEKIKERNQRSEYEDLTRFDINI